ncbi:MAG: 4Fe-4S dicluster domain-containing protein, partial [Methanocalculaceae archaeon]|nr:4Fe-4S dicluster domain-containing protein [Methanocalculaceae archaeon]
MAGLPMIKEILMQSMKKPVTNLFPAVHLPKSLAEFFESVADGKAEIIPPIATPPAFRGKIAYDRNICNGCGLCLKVCPAHAIEQVAHLPTTNSGTNVEGNIIENMKMEKRIRIYVANCVFCGQCTDICS